VRCCAHAASRVGTACRRDRPDLGSGDVHGIPACPSGRERHRARPIPRPGRASRSTGGIGGAPTRGCAGRLCDRPTRGWSRPPQPGPPALAGGGRRARSGGRRARAGCLPDRRRTRGGRGAFRRAAGRSPAGGRPGAPSYAGCGRSTRVTTGCVGHDVSAAPPTVNRPRSVAARALRASIGAYQWAFAWRPSPCRFVPSCSQYALEAVERHGALRGTRLTIARLARCHPWGPHGEDPVPAPEGK